MVNRKITIYKEISRCLNQDGIDATGIFHFLLLTFFFLVSHYLFLIIYDVDCA